MNEEQWRETLSDLHQLHEWMGEMLSRLDRVQVGKSTTKTVQVVEPKRIEPPTTVAVTPAAPVPSGSQRYSEENGVYRRKNPVPERPGRPRPPRTLLVNLPEAEREACAKLLAEFGLIFGDTYSKQAPGITRCCVTILQVRKVYGDPLMRLALSILVEAYGPNANPRVSPGISAITIKAMCAFLERHQGPVNVTAVARALRRAGLRPFVQSIAARENMLKVTLADAGAAVIEDLLQAATAA